MTDKASTPDPDRHGYVVKVRVPYLGGGTETTIFYSLAADAGKARAAARALAGVGDDAEAIVIRHLIGPEAAQLHDKFGLADGATMHWVSIRV
jgi:hypothetical protein